MDDGPITFEAVEDLDSLRCTVHGGRWSDAFLHGMQFLGGAMIPAGLLAWVWGLVVGNPLALGVGYVIAAGNGLLGLVILVAVFSFAKSCRPYFLRWGIVIALIFAAMTAFIGGGFAGLSGMMLGGIGALGVEALVSALWDGVAMRTPTTFHLTAHELTMSRLVETTIPAAEIEVEVESDSLRINGDRIEMGAHAPWEREWLAERIARVVEGAKAGERRLNERQAIRDLLQKS